MDTGYTDSILSKLQLPMFFAKPVPHFYNTYTPNMFIPSIHPAKGTDSLCLPLILDSVSAGLPSPGGDFLQSTFNLNEALIPRPAATFLMRVRGDLLQDFGLNSGDLIIVDRSVEPIDGAVIIAVVEGVLTVKRFHKSKGTIRLVPENSYAPPIVITKEMDFYLWGVITHIVHCLLVE